jgi:hypothetical protein
MENLPQKLLNLILGQLIERPTPHQYRDTTEWRDNIRYLCQARLVCQQWNSLATPHLFRNIVLAYTENKTQVWDQILDSEVVQHARSVYIRTSPPDDYPNGDWGEIAYEPYQSLLESIKRIEELENIETLYLRFSRHCRGSETFASEVEGIQDRQQVLENLFTAMHNRRQVERNRPIRSLTIENLQNLPLPHFTSSNLFKDVMKDVDHLHLMVVEEYDDAGPDWHMHCVERRIFEPYLHREWLTSFSNHLVSLTLYFRDFWGVIPGAFDGKGLALPLIKTLTLGNYVIGRHRQFDWVLNQKSLTSLRMDKCAIVSYIIFPAGEQWQRYELSTHDWDECPAGSFDTKENDAVFSFTRTWETVFDGIRSNLPRLSDFRFHCESPDTFFPVRPETLFATLHKMRYCVFDGRWMILAGQDMVGVRMPSDGQFEVNRAEETEAGDDRALKALLEEIRMR